MIKKFIKYFKDIYKNDPVYNCTLYREEGCSYVDGMLCDFPDCSMNNDYEIQKIMNMSDEEVLANMTEQDHKDVEETRKMMQETLKKYRNKTK